MVQITQYQTVRIYAVLLHITDFIFKPSTKEHAKDKEVYSTRKPNDLDQD